MRRVHNAVAFTLAIAIFSINVSSQEQRTGKVMVVSDGDTITVQESHGRTIKVRLAGIDAPEKGQDFADRSKRNLSSLVFGKSVKLQGNKVDRYGRLVAKVLIGSTDANLEQVRAGYAWHFKEYENEQTVSDRNAYAVAETDARKVRINIWSFPNPAPPWDYRASQRSDTQTANAPTPLYSGSTSNGSIIGNKNSKIFHLPSCPSYDKVAPHNRVYFSSRQQAEAAGYRIAKNC